MNERDHHLMTMAARLALRGHGGAEPNPLVGCVIAGADGGVVGWGYHRRCGGPHAEIHALRRAGPRAAGATAYVTLEPCDHTGRTGPCTEALIRAGVGRVVVARRDPSADAGGGARRLERAKIAVEPIACPVAAAVSDPFVHRIRTGLPWVIAKWAQTVDGRIATRTGRSRWISSPASRRLVHRERGRVDAILTGIGSVLADDPRLTARGVRVRRVARRVVIDPDLRIPVDGKLLTTARAVPTIVVCDEDARRRHRDRADRAVAAGAALMSVPAPDGELPLATVLRRLRDEHEVATVLVEGGGRVLGRLFRDGLVNEAWVFVAPMILGDDRAVPCVSGLVVDDLADAPPLTLVSHHRRDGDIVLHYRTERPAT